MMLRIRKAGFYVKNFFGIVNLKMSYFKRKGIK